MNIAKRLLLVVPALLMAAVAVGLFLYSPASEAKPGVTWEPTSIYQSLAAGETVTTTVTFTATTETRNVKVTVVPEIAPYVSVSPSSFPTLSKNVSYTVDVTVTAHLDDLVGVYDGTIQVQQGKRTLAQPLPVDITIAPIPLPPDPGEAGKLTIEGIDSDSDGVRDDVQRWIAFKAYTSDSGRAALTQNAKALQQFLLSQSDDAAITASREQSDAIHCLFFVRGDYYDAPNLIDELTAQMLNTNARSLRYIDLQGALKGQAYSTHVGAWESSCTFDPWEFNS